MASARRIAVVAERFDGYLDAVSDDEKHSSSILPEARIPEDAPGLLANHASRMFNRRVDAMLRPHGVPMAHLSPLMALNRWGSMMQRDLLKVGGIAQPAMVHALTKLEEAGLISRERTLQDRRAATIALTPRGKALVDACSPLLIQANVDALAGFTAAESRTLSALLKRLVANLQGDGSADEMSDLPAPRARRKRK